MINLVHAEPNRSCFCPRERRRRIDSKYPQSFVESKFFAGRNRNKVEPSSPTRGKPLPFGSLLQFSYAIYELRFCALEPRRIVRNSRFNASENPSQPALSSYGGDRSLDVSLSSSHHLHELLWSMPGDISRRPLTPACPSSLSGLVFILLSSGPLSYFVFVDAHPDLTYALPQTFCYTGPVSIDCVSMGGAFAEVRRRRDRGREGGGWSTRQQTAVTYPNRHRFSVASGLACRFGRTRGRRSLFLPDLFVCLCWFCIWFHLVAH
ncbi:hypothetical protein C8J56DRAFT_188323 [Mycena floridula]|nr:hypothetical protein C8J56DRAFT_188323 [Mycena floridula]